MLSSWSFICLYAVVPFFELFRLIEENAYAGHMSYNQRQVAKFLATIAFGVLLFVTVVNLLRHPYVSDFYRPVQLAVGVAAIGTLGLAIRLLRDMGAEDHLSAAEEAGKEWRAVVLSAFPILALVHLSMGVHDKLSIARDRSLDEYLRERISVEISKPFRGYAATIWLDERDDHNRNDANRTDTNNQKPGIDLGQYYLNRFDETFYLWVVKHFRP